MQQRTFDFNADPLPSTHPIADSGLLLPPPLIRPDRQLTYGGLSPEEWPRPPNDRDTITIDRTRGDIDGPPHRFFIKQGDTVEIFQPPNQIDIGEVTEINHHTQQVRAVFHAGDDGAWLPTHQIFPTVEESGQPTTQPTLPPRSIPISPPRPPPACYSLADFKDFHEQRTDDSFTFASYRDHFERLVASKEALPEVLKSEFKAKNLAALARRMGCWDAARSTKDENAANIYRKMLAAFVLEETFSYSLETSFEEAVSSKVRGYTQQDFTDAQARKLLASEERDRVLRNPQSFLDFRRFLQERSEDELSDEQLQRYDALHTDFTRDSRAAQLKTTVAAFESQELAHHEFQITEGYHDKRRCPLWIVELGERVERSTFDELNRKAKMLGGRYSSFKRSQAGFQFFLQDAAEQFVGLLGGDADRSELIAARKLRKEQSASERLHDLATILADRAEETLAASNEALQNTARRADIQAGVRGRAYADAALARTMHSIAEALSRGEAKYLDGIRHKSQVETLDMLLRVALFARLRHDPHPNSDSGRQPNLLDVRYASYPYPTIYRKHLERATLHGQSARGMKQTTARLAKRLRQDNAEYLSFQHDHDVELLEQFVAKLKPAGYDTEVFGWALEKYQRLQRANITDIHELRAALREYLEHRAAARGDDPVKVAERDLIGKKLSGLFPTPRAVIIRMLELAEIEPQHRVLEPSCGKGDILDAIQADHPDAALHAIELNHTLADILSAKGHAVEFRDFLEYRGSYDRIVMNPPFENGQDVDHIRHAYSLLAAGGRLVSVVSEGPFFRTNGKCVSFRNWLDEVSAEVEALPDDSFSGAHAFRQTSARTRLVTITKGADA